MTQDRDTDLGWRTELAGGCQGEWCKGGPESGRVRSQGQEQVSCTKPALQCPRPGLPRTGREHRFHTCSSTAAAGHSQECWHPLFLLIKVHSLGSGPRGSLGKCCRKTQLCLRGAQGSGEHRPTPVSSLIGFWETNSVLWVRYLRL